MPEIQPPQRKRPNASEPRATMQVLVGVSVIGTWRLPREQITVGRARTAAARLPFDRVPRILATVVPYSSTPSVLVQSKAPREGWLLINGERTRARALNHLAIVEAKPSGVVALQEGTTTVTWPELDEAVTLIIVVGSRRADPALPLARDRASDDGAVAVQGTLIAMERNEVGPNLRHSMAVLFEYLLEWTPKPVNVYKTAAQQLGTTEAGLKRSAERVMGRINKNRRGDPIDTVDQLGHYLVTTAGLITNDDLRGGTGR